jgi:hypothetical protein
MDDAWRNHPRSTSPGAASNATASTALGIRGGTDQNCGDVYGNNVVEAVSTGQLLEAELDLALVHAFTMRIRLGMFDSEEHVVYRNISRYGLSSIDTPHARKLALQAAEESLVLLRNDRGLLPLNASSSSSNPVNKRALTVGVVGPTADDPIVIIGGKKDYCPSYRVTPLQGISAHANATALKSDSTSHDSAGYRSDEEGVKVMVVAGPWLAADDMDDWKGADGAESDADALTTVQVAAEDFAQSVDVVVLCLGGRKMFGMEGNDQNTTVLPPNQLALAKAVMLANRNVVVVLIHGNQIALDSLEFDAKGSSSRSSSSNNNSSNDGDAATSSVPAAHTIIDAFEGGQSAGTALASILFGDTSPSGVLPWTVYPSDYIKQVQMTDMSMRANGIGRTYRFYKGQPTFPFFFGLSYTSFDLVWGSRMPPSSISVTDLAKGVEYAVEVTNNGTAVGSKVVAAFFSWVPAGTGDDIIEARNESNYEPIKQLFALQKVFKLAPGKSATVHLRSNMLAGHCAFCSTDDDGVRMVRPGTFTVTVGDGGTGASGNLLLHQFIATGKAKVQITHGRSWV